MVKGETATYSTFYHVLLDSRSELIHFYCLFGRASLSTTTKTDLILSIIRCRHRDLRRLELFAPHLGALPAAARHSGILHPWLTILSSLSKIAGLNWTCLQMLVGQGHSFTRLHTQILMFFMGYTLIEFFKTLKNFWLKKSYKEVFKHRCKKEETLLSCSCRASAWEAWQNIASSLHSAKKGYQF